MKEKGHTRASNAGLDCAGAPNRQNAVVHAIVYIAKAARRQRIRLESQPRDHDMRRLPFLSLGVGPGENPVLAIGTAAESESS